MITIAYIVAGIVAMLHLGFMVLEMFLWDKTLGLKVFGHSKNTAVSSKILAANQGLYNGFLAAGLIWGLLQGVAGKHIVIFFLCCVLIAGLFGGFTAGRKIFFIQALPAAFGLALILLGG